MVKANKNTKVVPAAVPDSADSDAAADVSNAVPATQTKKSKATKRVAPVAAPAKHNKVSKTAQDDDASSASSDDDDDNDDDVPAASDEEEDEEVDDADDDEVSDDEDIAVDGK